MIQYKSGDLLKEDVVAIVNTVNCVGVMGRGIALQFKKRFPNNFKLYESACKRNEVVPGKMFVYETGSFTNPRFIINFPTKRHWRADSRIEDIKEGLNDLKKVIKDNQINSIALPPLGCGLGGLNWMEVKPLIERTFQNLPNCNVVVFEPLGTPVAKELIQNTRVPKMTAGRAALVELVYRYLEGLLDPFITLIEVHKLLYFLQESGENLRLNYTKGYYGPYAENLRHVLNAVEGHYLSGYADGGDKPDKELKLVPGAYKKASTFLAVHQKTKYHFDRVADLVEGFESPFGLELLATVHWIVKNETVKNGEDVLRQTYSWNERKKQFSPRQIELALAVLSDKGWIDIKEC
ncbi:MAG: macro domain-containing protein [Fibrobacter sp.]|nr:macro domain-containing protein [Fibrobacter sp.]